MSKMTDKDVRRLNEIGSGAYAAKLGDIVYDINQEVDSTGEKTFDQIAKVYDSLIQDIVTISGKGSEKVNITFDTSAITGVSGVPATSTVSVAVGSVIPFPTFPVVPGKWLKGLPTKNYNEIYGNPSLLNLCYAMESETIAFSYSNAGSGTISSLKRINYQFYDGKKLIYSEIVGNGDRIPVPPALEPHQDGEVFEGWYYYSPPYGRNNVFSRNVKVIPGEYPTFHPCEYVTKVKAQWNMPPSLYSDGAATLSMEDEGEIPAEAGEETNA